MTLCPKIKHAHGVKNDSYKNPRKRKLKYQTIYTPCWWISHNTDPNITHTHMLLFQSIVCLHHKLCVGALCLLGLDNRCWTAIICTWQMKHLRTRSRNWVLNIYFPLNFYDVTAYRLIWNLYEFICLKIYVELFYHMTVFGELGLTKNMLGVLSMVK